MSGAVLLALAGCAPGHAVASAAPHGDTKLQRDLFAAGVKRFTFDGWAGPAFPVWTYRPADAPADAPVLFVFHGVQRDADKYIGEWVDLARRKKIVLIVPEYSRAAFPGVAAYSHGWFTDKDGTARPADRWSFASVEPIFAAVRAREKLTATTYSLYGHSGGAQFGCIVMCWQAADHILPARCRPTRAPMQRPIPRCAGPSVLPACPRGCGTRQRPSRCRWRGLLGKPAQRADHRHASVSESGDPGAAPGLPARQGIL